MEEIVLNVFDFLFVVLAVWRISLMLFSDHGPFDILDWFRHKIGVEVTVIVVKRLDMPNEYSRSSDTMLGNLFNCPFCLSFWVSLVFVPYLMGYGGFVYELLVAFFALWGAVTLLLAIVHDVGGE